MSATTSTWSQLRSCRARVPPHVVRRAFAEETVVLNIRLGQYYGIDSIGESFLEVIVEAPTMTVASERLAERYSQPLGRIEADLTDFVDHMLRRELIEIVPE